GDTTVGFLVDTPDGIAGAVRDVRTLDAAPDVEETGATLEENARIKAAALADAYGLDAVADDTGLEVDALGGAPGVPRARYGGADQNSAKNVEKLLRALDGVEEARRDARFVTVALARLADGREIVTRGAVEGSIIGDRRGAEGFGYDPVFRPRDG